jgi:alanyl-tRNA synthetase
MQLTTFQQTIKRGQRKLNNMLSKKDNGHITGEKVVHLEKKLGLPKVLTYNALREKGIQIPEKMEYKEALDEWRENLDN